MESSSAGSSGGWVFCKTQSSPPPIPASLRTLIPQPQPWRPSQGLEERTRQASNESKVGLRKVELLSTDPEHAFVLAYFNHQRPPGMRVTSMHYLFNPILTQAFEEELSSINAEAQNLPPHWKHEPHRDLRERVIQRWHTAVDPFSPIQLDMAGRIKHLALAKVIPLWRSINEEQLSYVCQTGCVYFGRHHPPHGLCEEGAAATNSFGNGIYFTNSARYASLCNKGLLLLSWVAMREPYPVVSDVPTGRISDLIKLNGLSAYQNYNAHYIPLASTGSNDPRWLNYAACLAGQMPAFDELVVFLQSQVLPQFCVQTEPTIIQEVPQHVDEQLIRACCEGNLGFVRQWLEANPRKLDTKSAGGETLFHIAAQNGQIKLLDWLYAKKTGFLRQTTSQGATPLYAALLARQFEAVCWIHQKSPAQIEQKTADGWSLAHVAAFTGQAEALSWLVGESPKLLEALTKEGWSLAYIAAMGGQVNTLAALKERPNWQKMLETPAKDRSTALHAAAFRNQLEALSWLFEQAPTLANVTSKQNNTVVHWAAAGGAIDVLAWILNNHPALALQPNRSGETALHTAARLGRGETVQALFSSQYMIKDNNGHTALHIAAIHGRPETVFCLIDLGADPFEATSEGENIFHFCADYGHLGLLQKIIQRTRKKDGFHEALCQEDSDGKTPLHTAVWRHPKPEIVQTLVDHGANVHAPSKFLYTPLHWAAKNGHVASARILLKAGARSPGNEKGEIPFDLAFRAGQDEMCLLLTAPDQIHSVETLEDGADPKAHCYRCFERAYEEGNAVQQIFYLEKHAALSLEEKKYIEATHLLNSAYQLAAAHQLSDACQKKLLTQLESLERKFIREALETKVPATYRGHLQRYRDRLAQIRQDTQNGLDANQSIATLQAMLTQKLKDFLIYIINDSIAVLGKPPTDYAVVTLGSMSREEMSPYSDAEFAFFIKNAEGKEYFRSLARLLELKFLNLGETRFELIRPKRTEGLYVPGKSLTYGGFSLDIGGLAPLGKAGVYELIGTPEELSRFQTADWQRYNEGEVILTNAMARPSYLVGNEKLVSSYRRLVKKQLGKKTGATIERLGFTSHRKLKALELIRDHVTEFRPWLAEGRLEVRAFDVKKDFYRPFQIVIEALALYYKLTSVTTMNRIDELAKKKVLSPKGAEHLKQVLAIALTWRLRVQLFYREEKEIMLHVQNEEDRHYFPIGPQESEQIIEIYRVQSPFYQAAAAFLTNPAQGFYRNELYDAQIGLSTALEDGDLYEMERQYIQSAAFNPNHKALGNLGSSKLTTGQAMESLKYETERLALLKRTNPELTWEIALCINRLGQVHMELGRWDKARDYFEQSLVMNKQQYGARANYEVPSCTACLGHVCQHLGHQEKSIEYYQESLEAFKQFHGGTPHSDIAKVLSSLALANHALGRSEQAIRLEQQSLAITKQLHGDKPQLGVTTSLNSLGTFYSALGRQDEAAKLLSEALEMCKQLYANRPHPHIAMSLSNLGTIYSEQNRFSKALECYLQSFQIFKQFYGDEPHPAFLGPLNNLVVFYTNSNQLEKALEKCLESLAICKKLYEGKPHPSVGTILNNLGEIYRKMGQLDRALEHFEQSLAMGRQLYGDRPRQSACISLNNIGSIYHELNQFDRAIEFYQQALLVARQLHGDNPHRSVATSLNNLGLAYQELDCLEKAIDYLQLSFAVSNQLYDGKPHSQLATSLNNLGSIYRALGRFEKALEYHQHALAMNRKLYEDKPHPSIAINISNLGTVHNELGQFDKALAHHEQSLAMNKEIHGDTPHPEIITCLYNLGSAYQSMERSEEAVEHCQQALAMNRRLYGDKPHAKTAECLTEVAFVYQKLHRSQEALDLHQQCLAISRQLYGDNPHRNTALSIYNLAVFYGDQGVSGLDSFIDYSRQFLAMEKMLHQGQLPLSVKIAVSLSVLGLRCQNMRRFDEAIEYHHQCLELYQRIHANKPHADTAEALERLGMAHQVCERFEEALRYYEQFFAMHITLHKPDPVFLKSTRNISYVCRKLGRFKDAADYSYHNLKSCEMFYGNEPHADVVACLKDAGLIAQAMGLLELALNCIQGALRTSKVLHSNEPHAEVAMLENHLGTLYMSLGRYVEAAECYQQGLAMKALLPEDKPDPATATHLANMGVICRLLDRPEEAIGYLQRGLAMSKEIDGDKPEEHIAIWTNALAVSYQLLGRFQEAVEAYEKSLAIYRQLFGDRLPPNAAALLNGLGEAKKALGKP